MAKKEQKKKTLTEYQPSEAELEAIAIVRREKQNWENATAFVTERVAFKMRELIRTCRKNAYGIFDKPLDPLTGREKIWVPLTEVMVEGVVKNIDLDTKDINFRAKNAKGYATKDIIRAIVRDYLDKSVFGETLDVMERQLAIDGTQVWKTYKEDGKLIRKDVDLLNVYIDPTSPSIREAYRFTERSLSYPNELEGMTGWKNTKDLETKEGLPRVDAQNLQGKTTSTVKARDVYEMWGKIPKWILTENKEDRGVEVDGHVVVSGLDIGDPLVHLIEENIKKDYEGVAVKPYEEAWYKKMPNRWYGRGVAEQLLMLQLWMNTIVNIRINRATVSQLGIFKIKKGSGITPQMISRLGTNGAIQVSSMDDIEQLVMQEASQASYNDEKNIIDWAQRLTNAFEIVTGEQLPSSTPATNAAIQNSNAKNAFSMIKEGIGMFLQRWLNRHAVPIIVETKDKEDIVRIVGNDDVIQKFTERAIAFEADKILDELRSSNMPPPSPQELLTEIKLAEEKLNNRGELFIKVLEELVADNVDATVSITNENFDPAVITDKLINMLQIAPEYRDSIIKELYNILGLDQPQEMKIPMLGQPQGMPIMGNQTPQQQSLNANQPPLNA